MPANSHVWKAGLPNASGVYNASTEMDPTARRYFYATLKLWSAPWYDGDPPDVVIRAVKTLNMAAGPILWRDTDSAEVVAINAAQQYEATGIVTAGSLEHVVQAFNCLTGLSITVKQAELFRFLLAYVEDDAPRAG